MPIIKNQRHERFAQELAKGMSAGDAYVAAGYKNSRSSASRLSTKANIVSRVAELAERGANRAVIDIARTLQEMVRLGTSDVRKLFDPSGNLLPIAELDDATAASVASVEVVTRTLPGADDSDEEMESQPHGGALKRTRGAAVEYVHKIRFWDKNAALDKIAKHLGMFIERLEHSGSVAGPAVPQDPGADKLAEIGRRYGNLSVVAGGKS